MLKHRFVNSTTVHFESPDRDKISGWRYASAQIPPGVPPRFQALMIEAIEKVAGLLASETVPKFAKVMTETLEFLSENGVFKESERSWNEILLLHFVQILQNKDVEYRTRIMKWQNTEKVYKELAFLGAIPRDVIIPSGTVGGGCSEDAIAPFRHKREILAVPKSLDELLPKHALAVQGLELEDDEFLEKLRQRLQEGADASIELLTSYWDKMRTCWDIGKELMAKVTPSEFELCLKNKLFLKDGMHVAHPSAPQGIAWFLRGVQHYALNTYELSKLNFNKMRELPFFAELLTSKHINREILRKLMDVSGEYAPPYKEGSTQPTELISRLLGLLSKRDCAAACCILTIENPSFTADSVENADLYSHSGKFYLKAQTLHQRIVFSVSKPRARKRKSSVLSPLSASIVMDIVRATSAIRERQKFLRKRNWRKLFLISTRKQIGSNSRPSSIVSTGSGITLYSLFEARLKQCEIDRFSFNLSTMRSNQAILCFLKHGSVKMVADLLNNSIQVVKSNYIPLWMLIYWANRILRTLQQTFIIVATEGSPWQLEASDFLDATSLRKFITKILRNLKGGDAFSEMIRDRLGKYTAEALPQAHLETGLLIPMGVRELSFLYAYADVVTPQEALETSSDNSALSDSQIRTIASLVRRCDCIIDDDLSIPEYAVLEKIAGDSLMQFQRTHLAASKQAEALKIVLREKLPKIEQQGGDQNA